MPLESLEPMNADKRTLQRYIHNGLLDEHAYQKYLQNLPDVADKATPIETTMALGGEDATALVAAAEGHDISHE